MFMLDTNYCIFLQKNRSLKLINKIKFTNNIMVSSIVFAELCFGVEKGEPHLRAPRYAQWDLLLSGLTMEEWGSEAALAYGKIRADLQRRGEIIGNNDMLIAAHALSLGATLVTNNIREFSRINSLKLEDWTLDL
jgi:tRNA(fMet)-specific endonuclease VapC